MDNAKVEQKWLLSSDGYVDVKVDATARSPLRQIRNIILRRSSISFFAGDNYQQQEIAVVNTF